jgi:hypothetical protein
LGDIYKNIKEMKNMIIYEWCRVQSFNCTTNQRSCIRSPFIKSDFQCAFLSYWIIIGVWFILYVLREHARF